NLVLELSQGKHVNPDDLPTYEFVLHGEKHFQARGRPVQGEEMEYQGAVVVLEDITALKVLDQVKSEFVAKVSHELRSPLSTIHEQLAMVLGEMVGDESKNDQYILARAKEKTHGLISLIGDLLDLSRIEAACLPENQASRGLLEKAGFKYEGVAQSYLQIDGRWRTHVLYAALRKDRRGRTDVG
ncbi:hypothetical protein LCGC14_2996670, partial [marine sediment metagenome]